MASQSTSRHFPGFSSVYHILGTGSEGPFYADIDVTDEQNFAITRAELKLPHPVQARWALGRKKPGDVIWTTLVNSLLVSERVVNLLRDKGFTGWGTYDVHLLGHDGTPIPGYYGFSVHGRCGPVDESKAVEVPRIFPARIRSVWLGMYFEPETWDGSDLFMPEYPQGAKFVTEDVKRALENAKIKNLCFTPLNEAEVFPPQALWT